jgi:hypothetical protein
VVTTYEVTVTFASDRYDLYAHKLHTFECEAEYLFMANDEQSWLIPWHAIAMVERMTVTT